MKRLFDEDPFDVKFDECATMEPALVQKIANTLGLDGASFSSQVKLCEAVATKIGNLLRTDKDNQELKPSQRGKVVRHGSIVVITDPTEAEFDRRLSFLQRHQHTDIVPQILSYDRERLQIVETFIPSVTLESLKRKKMSLQYVLQLQACLEETFSHVQRDYQDFSNLNNFGVIERDSMPIKVVIFEGGKDVGAPLTVEDFVKRLASMFGTKLEKGKYRL